MQALELFTRHILTIPFWFGLAVLGVIVLFQILRRELLKKYASRIFLYSSGIVFAYLIYVSFLQFRAFQDGILGPTLGTKGGIAWFFGYVQLHFLNEYLVSFICAILFAVIGGFFNKKYNERFFEKEELYLLALGILLVGYPSFIFYVPFTLFISAIVSLIFMKKGERLPLYHFWVPSAITILLIAHFLGNEPNVVDKF